MIIMFCNIRLFSKTIKLKKGFSPAWPWGSTGSRLGEACTCHQQHSKPQQLTLLSSPLLFSPLLSSQFPFCSLAREPLHAAYHYLSVSTQL